MKYQFHLTCRACPEQYDVMDGHHYCPSCWERDDDIIHTKDGRKWDDSSIEVVEVTEEELAERKEIGELVNK